MKKVFYLAGLPRSGSTLLSDLLAQNDDFHASPSSGLRDMIELVKNNWNGNEHFKASFDINKIDALLKGMMQSYYSTEEASVIFDKNRGWTGAVELANLLSHDNKAKIIVCVRNVVEIIASLEKMYRKNAHDFALPQEKANFAQFQLLANRCEAWVNATGMIGAPYVSILEALNRGYRDNLLFVDYNKLTIEPEAQLKRIYEFIDIEFDEKIHYFDNVISSNHEYEMARGFPQSLHQIRAEVKPQVSDAFKVLGKENFEKYSNSEFWNQFI